MSKQKGFSLRIYDYQNYHSMVIPPLPKLNAMIPRENSLHKLNRILKKEAKGPGGRSPFDYIMMFQILVLQRIFNLSDS